MSAREWYGLRAAVRQVLTFHVWQETKALVKNTVDGWLEDRAPRLGAALAFYTLLSLAPIVIVVIAIASVAFGEAAAEGQLMWQIQDLVGLQGAAAIQGLLKSARGVHHGWLATSLGLLTLVFGATAVMNELRDALNTIWHVVPPKAPDNWRTILAILRQRVFSFVMVIGIGFFLVASLIVNATFAAFGPSFDNLLPMPEWMLQLNYSAMTFIVTAILFAILYKVMPDVRLEWRDVVVGSIVTSLLFSIGKSLIGLYLGKTGVANAYGAAGSLVIVLVWVYYSAQVLFFGAEFTCVYAHRYGSLKNRSASEAIKLPAGVEESSNPERNSANAQAGHPSLPQAHR
jgi:membrane protein